VQVVLLPSGAEGNPGRTDNQSGEGAEQPAPAQPVPASVVRVATNLALPASAAPSAPIPLPVTAEQAQSREAAAQPLALPPVVALSPAPLNVPAPGAVGVPPAAAVVFGLTTLDNAPADQPHHLAPEAGPDSGGGAAERPGSVHPALPALAGLLTPAAAGVGPGPFRFLRRLFPGASAGWLDRAVGGRWLLRASGVAAAVTAAAGLEVLRRRARRPPCASELPEITGPAGL
jgi:hypothetical protein